MTLAVDRMDGHGHINTACRECLSKKTMVMQYQLQKDYPKVNLLLLLLKSFITTALEYKTILKVIKTIYALLHIP